MVDGIEYKDMSSSGKLTFSLPKIPDGASVQLLTPQFLNGELKVEISTLSQGSAGDVARSDAVELTVSILPEADGVKVTTLGNGIGVEDEGFVSLPINAQLIDRNEDISEIVITGSKGEISQVVFMAPKGYEGLSLDGFLNQVDDVFTIDTAGWAER